MTKTAVEAMWDLAECGNDFRLQGDEVGAQRSFGGHAPEVREADASSLGERFKRSLANIEALRSPNPFGPEEPTVNAHVPKRTREQSILMGLLSAQVVLAQAMIGHDESVASELVQMLTEASDRLLSKDNDEIAARIVESLIKAIEALNGPGRKAN